MNLRISAIVDLLACSQPHVKHVIALGFCEHFVYAAEYLSGYESFGEALRKLWEWELRFVDAPPQELVMQLMELLPDVDPDAEADLRQDLIVSSAALVEQGYRCLSGEVGMVTSAFFTSCDLITLHANFLDYDTSALGWKPLEYADALSSEFCEQYVCQVECMLKALPLVGVAELGEWRIDQQQWGLLLKDRVEAVQEAG